MTDDPFAPFRELFDQGDSPVMLPMVPFYVPDAGGEMTPERYTKAALGNLYRMASATASGSDRSGTVWERYLDAAGFDVDATDPSQYGAVATTTWQVWVLSLAQFLVEAYTVRLVHDELVAADHRSATGTQEWLWRLPQSDREQLLLRCLGCEEDLVAAMQATRERRNELLFDMGSWAEMNADEATADARRALSVLDRLADRVTGGSGLRYLPGDTGDGSAD